MAEDDDILAELEEAEAPRLEAVVSAVAYTIPLFEADIEAVTEKDKWEHLEGVLYRRRCHSVSHNATEGLLMFSIGAGEANIDDVVSAIAEEMDEITGRKMEAAGAEAWGMF